jgi:hypothetical protein
MDSPSVSAAVSRSESAAAAPLATGWLMKQVLVGATQSAVLKATASCRQSWDILQQTRLQRQVQDIVSLVDTSADNGACTRSWAS